MDGANRLAQLRRELEKNTKQQENTHELHLVDLHRENQKHHLAENRP